VNQDQASAKFEQLMVNELANSTALALADKDREISAWIAACNDTFDRAADVQRKANFWRQKYQTEHKRCSSLLALAIAWFLSFIGVVVIDTLARIGR